MFIIMYNGGKKMENKLFIKVIVAFVMYIFMVQFNNVNFAAQVVV